MRMKISYSASIRMRRPDGKYWVDLYSSHPWPWFQERYWTDDISQETLVTELEAFKVRCSTSANIRIKSLAGPIST